MKNLKYLLPLAVLSLLLGCNRSDTGTGTSVDSQTTSAGASSGPATSGDATSARTAPDTSASAVQPDNTGKNVRDRSDASLTPGDQGGNESDREITRRIRRALTSNDQLSTDAKNIKVMTTDGKVTLRGPVNSADEQKTIESLAKQNGGTSVDDQLEVKAPKTQ